MTHPTVHLTELVLDGNFKDNTFSGFVDTWMAKNMPGLSLNMLSTDFERWQVEPDNIHEAEKVIWDVWECPECGENYSEDPDECCYQDDEDETPIPLVKTGGGTGWAVREENYGNLVGDDEGYASDVTPWKDHETELEGTDSVYVWDKEHEADEAAEWLDAAYDSEHGHESRSGWPWAWNWCLQPEDYISDPLLKKAGFTVATYVGGNGDWKEDCEFRLCGIDGGGYGFKGAHFAKLVAYVCEESGRPVQTDNGFAYITTDDRSDLEQLAAVACLDKEAL